MMHKKNKRTVKALNVPVKGKVKNPLGLISKKEVKRYLGVRMRPSMIDSLNSIRAKVERKTRAKFSQSMLLEAAIKIAEDCKIEELVEYYSRTHLL